MFSTSLIWGIPLFLLVVGSIAYAVLRIMRKESEEDAFDLDALVKKSDLPGFHPRTSNDSGDIR